MQGPRFIEHAGSIAVFETREQALDWLVRQ